MRCMHIAALVIPEWYFVEQLPSEQQCEGQDSVLCINWTFRFKPEGQLALFGHNSHL